MTSYHSLVSAILFNALNGFPLMLMFKNQNEFQKVEHTRLKSRQDWQAWEGQQSQVGFMINAWKTYATTCTKKWE